MLNMFILLADIVISKGEASLAGDPLGPQNPPVNGANWVDLFVKEMMTSSNMDDARIRASRVLEVLEKSVYTPCKCGSFQRLSAGFNFSISMYFGLKCLNIVFIFCVSTFFFPATAFEGLVQKIIKYD